MVDAGESLGLSATITGAPYDVTAITTAPSVVRFVKREDFLLFLRSFPESGLNAVHALSLEYQGAFDSLRSIALSHNATSRIAQLLLRMAANGSPESAGNIRLLLTQEQIAQMTARRALHLAQLLRLAQTAHGKIADNEEQRLVVDHGAATAERLPAYAAASLLVTGAALALAGLRRAR